MPHRVTVAILNWNGISLLKEFLPSVLTYSEGHEVVVIDNNSTDGSQDWLKENHPDLRLIQNANNLGFSAGYNEGLKEIDTDIVVLLNSDVEVTENWIDNVIDSFDDPVVGALQPKILDQKKKSHFEYAGASGGYIDFYGFPYCRGRVFEHVEEDKGQYDNSVEVHWATGACLFIRKDLYDETGGLDVDFFAHMEEIDLCWRIRNRGYTILCDPRSHVYHVGGATLSHGSSRKAYLNFRNNLFILIKNHRKGWTTGLIFVRMLLDGIAAFKFLFEGNAAAFLAVGRAHFHFYTSLQKMRSKRKAMKSIESESVRNHSLSVVFQHFIKGKKTFDELSH